MLIENIVKVVEVTIKSHIKYGVDSAKKIPNGFKPYTLHITGDTGIGKTESVVDTCTRMKIPCMIINPAQKTDSSDINGLPEKLQINGRIVTITTLQEFLPVEKSNENKEIQYRNDGGVMIDLESIKHYIDNYDEIIDFYDGDINQAPGIVVFWDEVNRTFAKDIQQLLFKVFLEYRLNNYSFPKGTCLIASSNPDIGEFDVAPMMREPAFKRRFIHIEATNNKAGFLRYADRENYNPLIKKVVNKHEGALTIPQTGYVRSLKIKPNHSSWRTINTLLDYTDLVSLGREIYEETFAGVIGHEMAAVTCDEMENESDILVSGKNVITDYPNYRHLVKDAPNDYQNAVSMSLISTLSVEENIEKLNVKENLENIYLFFLDLRPDIRMTTGDEIRAYNHAKRLLALHTPLYELLVNTKEEALKRK